MMEDKVQEVWYAGMIKKITDHVDGELYEIGRARVRIGEWEVLECSVILSLVDYTVERHIGTLACDGMGHLAQQSLGQRNPKPTVLEGRWFGVFLRIV